MYEATPKAYHEIRLGSDQHTTVYLDCKRQYTAPYADTVLINLPSGRNAPYYLPVQVAAVPRCGQRVLGLGLFSFRSFWGRGSLFRKFRPFAPP